MRTPTSVRARIGGPFMSPLEKETSLGGSIANMRPTTMKAASSELAITFTEPTDDGYKEQDSIGSRLHSVPLHAATQPCDLCKTRLVRMEEAVQRSLVHITSLAGSRDQLVEELELARASERKLLARITAVEVEKLELQRANSANTAQMHRLQRDYDRLRQEAEARRTALLACSTSPNPVASNHHSNTSSNQSQGSTENNNNGGVPPKQSSFRRRSSTWKAASTSLSDLTAATNENNSLNHASSWDGSVETKSANGKTDNSTAGANRNGCTKDPVAVAAAARLTGMRGGSATAQWSRDQLSRDRSGSFHGVRRFSFKGGRRSNVFGNSNSDEPANNSSEAFDKPRSKFVEKSSIHHLSTQELAVVLSKIGSTTRKLWEELDKSMEERDILINEKMTLKEQAVKAEVMLKINPPAAKSMTDLNRPPLQIGEDCAPATSAARKTVLNRVLSFDEDEKGKELSKVIGRAMQNEPFTAAEVCGWVGHSSGGTVGDKSKNSKKGKTRFLSRVMSQRLPRTSMPDLLNHGSS